MKNKYSRYDDEKRSKMLGYRVKLRKSLLKKGRISSEQEEQIQTMTYEELKKAVGDKDA